MRIIGTDIVKPKSNQTNFKVKAIVYLKTVSHWRLTRLCSYWYNLRGGGGCSGGVGGGEGGDGLPGAGVPPQPGQVLPSRPLEPRAHKPVDHQVLRRVQNLARREEKSIFSSFHHISTCSSCRSIPSPCSCTQPSAGLSSTRTHWREYIFVICYRTTTFWY